MPLLTHVAARTRRLVALGAGAALSFGLVGCQIIPEAQPDQTRYYVLASPAPSPATDEPERTLVVGLRPVELPGYLRGTRAMVVARGDNELNFRDFDRWAEPLDAALTRVLRDALSQTPPIARVPVFPFGLDHSRAFDVAVRVVHCEGVQTAERTAARFVVAYEILDPAQGGAVVKHSSFTAPLASWDGEPASLARLLGEAAALAAQAIANDLPR